MKTLVSMAALAAIALVGCNNDFSRPARGPAGENDLVLRAHFIGSERLLKDREAAKLAEVWKLKASADLRNEALNKFSRLPAAWMGNALPKGAGNQVNLFRPLLEDALANESFVEWHASSFTLAAKVSDVRAKAWDVNLRTVALDWKLGNPATFSADGNSGWEIAKIGAPALRFVRSGGWVAVTVGQGASKAEAAALAKLKALKPTGAWLEGDMNLSQWKQRLPLLEHYENLPVAHFSLSNRADAVRTLVQFNFPKAHQWKVEPWQVPTNFIWDPLVSFTVARGIQDALEEWPLFRNLGVDPIPNQVCAWGGANLPYQFHTAFATRNSASQLRRAQQKAPSELQRVFGTNLVGKLITVSNSQSFMWSGLPALPSVSSMQDGKNDFLFIQLAPLPRGPQRPPKELFAQFENRDDLVLYDWEHTQQRFPNIRQLFQLGEIATRRTLASTNAADVAWQLAIAPHLSDAITELRATSPTQMTLVRNSTIGFTSFELTVMSRWIQSADFPAFGIYPPQPARRIPNKPAAKPVR